VPPDTALGSVTAATTNCTASDKHVASGCVCVCTVNMEQC